MFVNPCKLPGSTNTPLQIECASCYWVVVPFLWVQLSGSPETVLELLIGRLINHVLLGSANTALLTKVLNVIPTTIRKFLCGLILSKQNYWFVSSHIPLCVPILIATIWMKGIIPLWIESVGSFINWVVFPQELLWVQLSGSPANNAGVTGALLGHPIMCC